MHRFEVVDRSMEPVLAPGDFLVGRRRPITAGDIVVFEHPERAGFHLVKRVVALGGQTIEITGGRVLIDGADVDPTGDLHHTAPPGRWEIPIGWCFVLSDARTSTGTDSRVFGPIPADRAVTVVFRYWPPGRIGRDFRPVA